MMFRARTLFCLCFLALFAMPVLAAGVNADSAGTVTPADEAVEAAGLWPTPVFLHDDIDPEPVPGDQQECEYTCEGSRTTWILICSGTEAHCCGIADRACPYVDPPSTGTSSCSCTPTGL
ncbi:MAG: hypothetical protein SX243_18970 [Acidobacteriota bacterium]|nr:hypothetical protein [Acidobacteriota bacterium]